jgi:glutamate synthase domain-containing protein 3
MVEEHLSYTGSVTAKRVLDDWDDTLPKFVKVMPIDYKRVLSERAQREKDHAMQVAHG